MKFGRDQQDIYGMILWYFDNLTNNNISLFEIEFGYFFIKFGEKY